MRMLFVALLFGAGALGLSCKSKQEKAADYLKLAQAADNFQGKSYYCDLALKYNPQLVDANIMCGDLWAQGKGAIYDSALVYFNKALELEPENSKALAYRAALYNALDNSDKAIEDINRAIDIKPDTFTYYRIRSGIYDNAGRTDEAKEDLKRAISLNDTCTICWYNYGVLYQKQDKDSAIDFFSRCLAVDSTFVNALINRGLLYASLKKFDKAIDDFSRGMSVDSTVLDFYKHRGTVYGLVDKNDLAIADFKIFISNCDPGSSEYFDVKTALSDLEKKMK